MVLLLLLLLAEELTKKSWNSIWSQPNLSLVPFKHTHSHTHPLPPHIPMLVWRDHLTAAVEEPLVSFLVTAAWYMARRSFSDTCSPGWYSTPGFLSWGCPGPAPSVLPADGRGTNDIWKQMQIWQLFRTAIKELRTIKIQHRKNFNYIHASNIDVSTSHSIHLNIAIKEIHFASFLF